MSVPTYRPPWYLPTGHLQTIVPALTRKVRNLAYRRNELPTPDGDRLQLDWLTQGARRLVVISHGLEGDSSRPYVRGMSRAFYREGYDVLAWNFRGCGDTPNHTLRFYHSGATDDLHHLLNEGIELEAYDHVVLVGFSLGGNLTLKYLGEGVYPVPGSVRAALAFSVPIDLQDCARRMARPQNWVYHRRFLRSLKRKVTRKQPHFPAELSLSDLNKVKTLTDFDDTFTAPLHGFDSAADYYRRCSSKQFLTTIEVPTMVVSARNDPFLGSACFIDDDRLHRTPVTFVAPDEGGHCGFMPRGHRRGENYWSEQVAVDFARTLDCGK
ncbi:MAG: alpha/beta fold hydrolase [Tunicatimonas sp.]